MKCKTHPYEHGVGVCASCLRERLFAVIAAQKRNNSGDFHHHHRPNSDVPPAAVAAPIPPPLVFPRSVSPYVTHRRSLGGSAAADASPAHHHRLQRFFSTPQVGPTFTSAGGGDHGLRRRSSGRFSVLKLLFNKSEDSDFKLGASRKASGSSSWLSGFIGLRKNKPAEDSAAPPARWRRYRPAVERGMSPETEGDYEREGNECSSDSSNGRRRPTVTPMRWFPSGHHRSSVGTISGFAFCLSPLVKSGTNGRRSQAAEVAVSGELRSSAAVSSHPRTGPVGAGGPALEPNRSRKLADFGRFK